MDLNEHRVDPKVRSEGAWVGEKYGTPIPEMGDLELRVRGADNKEWRKRADALVAAVPRKNRLNGLGPEDRDRISAICCRDHGLLEWNNLTIGGQAVPYSKEKAGELLLNPEWSTFRAAALWACEIVGTQIAAEVKEDAGK